MTIKVTITNREPWDCECCGTIYGSDAKIEFEDGRLIVLCNDDHFGGDWDGTEDDVYKAIIDELGIDVEFNYGQEDGE